MKTATVTALPGKPVRPPDDPTIIGRIARPVGLKGELKAICESVDPARLTRLDNLTIRLSDEYRSFHVIRSQPFSGWCKLLLEGINTPEDASLLASGEIVVSSAQRVPLPENEYFVDDLVGCIVDSDTGQELGILTEIIQMDHHDIWTVEGQFGEILIPAVREFILNVDLTGHRITIRQIEGLWNEN